MAKSDEVWRGWLIPAIAIFVAAAVVGFAVVTSPHEAAIASPSASAAVAVSASPGDDHLVVADDGTIEFRQEGADLVIRRMGTGSTVELARISAGLEQPSPGQTPVSSSSSFYVMVCDPDGSTPRRYVFGHMTGSLPLAYAGPDAVGHGARDGLFLFELKPGPIDPQQRITIKTADGGGLVGLGGGTFDLAQSEGTKQPSGCYTFG